MMRVGIVSRAENVSGKEIMTLELGEGLREESVEIHFITSFWNDGTYEKRLKHLQFPLSRMHLGGISATLRADCMIMTLRQLAHLPVLWADYGSFLKRVQPECMVHTSWHHLLLLWPYLTPCRDWFWAHEVLPDKWQYRLVFRRLARVLRGFVAVSEAVARSLRQLTVPEDKIHVVHNGLRDLSSGDRKAERNEGGERIAIVGQVEPWKGHQSLLEAFTQIAGQFPLAVIDVYGAGGSRYEKKMRHLAEVLGIGSRINWRGFEPDRARIFSGVDFCVIPSDIEESFGLAVLEAGYFGIPVIAFRRGGLVEIIEDGKTGFLVEPGNVDELASKMKAMLDNPDARMKMGLEARCRVRRLFNREVFAKAFNLLLTKAGEGSTQISD